MINIVVNAALISFHIVHDVILIFVILLVKDMIFSGFIYFYCRKRLTPALTYLFVLVFVSFRLLISSGLPRYSSYKLDGTLIEFSGIVSDPSVMAEGHSYYKNDIFETSNGQTGIIPHKKTVVIDSEFGRIMAVGLDGDVDFGKNYHITGEVHSFSKPRNPGGFNEKNYYASSGIYLKIYADKAIPGKESFSYLFQYTIRSLKRKMISGLYAFLPEQHAGLAAAIILGDTAGLSRDMRDMMRSAGVSHIAAVSGTAVFFIISPVRKILKKIRLSAKISRFLLISILICFGYLVGWSPSISRSISMILCVMFLSALKRKTGHLNAVSFSSVVMMIISPLIALQTGFWLSVVTASGIVWLYPVIDEKISSIVVVPDTISSLISLNLSAVISVLPLQIIISGCVPLISPLSNMLVIPVAGFVIPYGILFSFFAGTCRLPIVFQGFSMPLKGMIDWIISISSFFGGSFSLCLSTGKYVFLSFCGASVLVLLCIRGKSGSKFPALLLAVSFFTASVIGNQIDRSLASGLEVIFADVGQGDATILILDRKKAVVIDGGKPDSGYRAIRDILKYYSVRPGIYYATHCHSDHCGGLIGLMEEYGGSRLIVPYGTLESGTDVPLKTDDTDAEKITANFGEENLTAELLSSASRNDVAVMEASSGEKHLICDDLEIEILNPVKGTGDNQNDDLNKTSLVLMVKYKGLRIVICGDADGESEKRMVAEGKDLNADIYRISHHGSPASSDDEMISAVDAEVSVISVGYNSYGHPSDKVIKRLSEHGSQIYRTDINGALILRYNGKKTFLKTMLP